MNRETVIQLASEAGMVFQGGFTRVVECVTQDELEAFAKAIEQRTLERAAVELENEITQSGENVAAAIRALGEKA